MKKKRVYFNEVYSLKENEAVFLKRKNWIFSIVGGSISFVFFVLNKTFLQVRFQFFCYLWVGGGRQPLTLIYV